MRKFWILLAAATLAVIYFAVTPGGPLSVEPHSAFSESRIRAHAAPGSEENVAADIDAAMARASRTGRDPIVGETLDRVLGLLERPNSADARG